MNINVDNTKMRIEGSRLIIDIDSDIEKLLGINKTELSKLSVGEVFKSLTNVEYIVLEHFPNGTTKVIRKDLLKDRLKFDDENNNFASSSVNKYLNDEYFKDEITTGFGENNVVDHDIDLLSLDGLDDYGKTTVKVGLLTIDDYRRYRKNCLKGNMDSWWWLSTPDSTPSGYSGRCVQYVYDSGFVGYGGYVWGRGVRPVLILKSNIFVSFGK